MLRKTDRLARIKSPLMTKSSTRAASALIEVLDEQIKTLAKAQEEYAQFPQDKVDKIFRYVAHEASKHRVPLAQAAVTETRLGCFEDKVFFIT